MVVLKEKDNGTPAVKSNNTATDMITAVIDGQKVTVPGGTSIMRAASTAGIEIPRLCATDKLKSYGSCRLCLIEVEGRNNTPASCTTPLEEGMEISTETPRLQTLRKGIMELYISDHPLDCLTCASNGDCELQDMAGRVGLRDVRYGLDGKNNLNQDVDTSNPYFQFDPSKCIVCSRCVRACDEVQGTFALSLKGRGFDSKISVEENQDFFGSECVSCGACVQACPTATLVEKKVVEAGQPDRSVITTCAYCGVGCSFKAEMKGNDVVRMVPYKDGGANEGHSCVKGRFAWGYASHSDRITSPMVRDTIDQAWKTVTWDEAISFAANWFKDIQKKYGKGSIGGISSSRCTNEEVFVVQKMIRAAFGNNNIDTCARVCHSPTGYGLSQTFGTSAGTQDFKSIEKTDTIFVIGANPTDGHPVFASRIIQRHREGAHIIVADPRKIGLVKSPHVKAAEHLPVKPGANVALVNAMAHVIVHEGLLDTQFIEERCDLDSFEQWKLLISEDKNSPEQVEDICGVKAAQIRSAARLYANVENAAVYYGLGVTEHSQGSTMVMALANLAMLTGNIGREGVGINPLRGQNNVQGSCDMGSFPHEFSGYRHVSDDTTRMLFEQDWNVDLEDGLGLRIPNMFNEAIAGTFKGLFVHGEDIAQSDPNIKHVQAALKSMDCIVVQDLFLNETADFAHVFLPGTSFLEKDGTFTNAERRINRVRPAMPSQTGLQEWEIVCRLAQAMGYDMSYENSSEIMDEIARLTPSYAGVSFSKLDRVGSVQWPCSKDSDTGIQTMHEKAFVRGKGQFMLTEFITPDERATRKFPLILTTGRILSQYNVGAQTRRTNNIEWHQEDLLEIHPHDAQNRGIKEGDVVALNSRVGETFLRASVSKRMPEGVVYTTFHHATTGANVVTTEHSDWATNCPEYKVTAVQVSVSNHQLAGAQ